VETEILRQNLKEAYKKIIDSCFDEDKPIFETVSDIVIQIPQVTVMVIENTKDKREFVDNILKHPSAYKYEEIRQKELELNQKGDSE
jgi:SpoVK/Ycf46/Vps4 family AAA+-type ATPase